MGDSATTLLIILTGVAAVVGLIMLMRMHALLALLMGAAIVGSLTPSTVIEEYFLRKQAVPFEIVSSTPQAVDANSALIIKLEAKSFPARAASSLCVTSQLEGNWLISGTVEAVDETTGFWEAHIHAISETASNEQLQQSAAQGKLFLMTEADFRSSLKSASASLADRISRSFGDTCASVGLLIALAAVIGKCLLDSGAANRIVNTVLGWFGEKLAPVGFIISGFILATPVFFDTVFYLMIPLGKALYIQTRKNYLLYILTIIAGGTMAHSLVPPTPGPIFVADSLGVNLGLMIFVGTIVSIVCATYGYIHALILNHYFTVPLRTSSDFTEKDLENLTQRDAASLPPLWLSLLPILLPIGLIGIQTLISMKQSPLEPLWAVLPSNAGSLIQLFFKTWGQKTAAIATGVITGLYLLTRYRLDKQELSKVVQSALASGGVILLITAAGGAFGKILQQTGVSSLIDSLPTLSPAMLLTLGFSITVFIRGAQGSGTVAMITTVGLLSGIDLTNIGCHPVYLAIAIGSGSKPLLWMNDSGYWVMTQMSGMTPKETLYYVTPMTSMMGLVGLLSAIAGATWFPMV